MKRHQHHFDALRQVCRCGCTAERFWRESKRRRRRRDARVSRPRRPS